ncbi:MFS-type transporter SLC18B1-like isoform X2 [Artemia franciscana]|uniref:MFS-type transporter SLC18B1-like isoform X2 n=1 Tax=Artemia franciscana TaxID=6661 RepID=UPI0032DAACA4
MLDQSGRFATSGYGSLKANRMLVPASLEKTPARSLSEADLSSVREEVTEEDYQKIHDELRLIPSKFSVFRHTTRKQKTALLVLCFCNFFAFSNMSVIAPFFPQEALKKGMSITNSGFVFSFFAMVVFIVSPFVGKVIPTIGAKFTFLIGLFIAGSCSILFGQLVKVEDLYSFTILSYAIRGLEAFGAACFSTASCTFISDLFPNHVSSVMGFLETFIGLGYSVGPAIGGLLYSVGGYELPFLVLGGCILISIPIGCCLLPSLNGEKDERLEQNIGFWKVISYPGVLMVCLIIAATSAAWGAIDPTLSIHLHELGLTESQVGLIFLLESGVYALFSPFWGWICDKFHRTWSMMFIGLVSTGIGLLLLGPAPFISGIEDYFWLKLVALSWIGMAVALAFIPTYQSLINNATRAGPAISFNTHGIVAGIWSSMYSLGDVIGPGLGGVLLDYYGYPICMTVFAGMMFFVAWLIVVFRFFLKRFRQVETLPEEDRQGLENASLLEQSTSSVASSVLYGSCEF